MTKPSPLKKPKQIDECPFCGGAEWSEDEDGFYCAACCHPFGEAVEVRIKRKTVIQEKPVE